jgi:pimeloyl-ACP methyl ester carboxylesterase
MDSQLRPVRTSTPQAAATAVVFVHGFGGDVTDTWQNFPQLLAKEPKLSDWDLFTLGFDTRLRVDILKLWSADPDLKEVAVKLQTDAKAGVLKDYASLCLIAHSMGGLAVQRALLDHKGLRTRTSHLFLFGTPSGGLLKASLVRILKPQLRDMAKDGDFIRTLRGDWDAQFSLKNGKRLPFRFFAVGGERDEFVPFESSLKPFPDDAYPECRYVVPGNHVQIVKPESADSASARLVVNGLVGTAAPGGPWNAARVAVESRDFERAVELLEPEKDRLDQDGLVRLALSLEGVGRTADAIQLLTARGKLGTDAMGVLAGRLKRRWLLTQKEDDAQRAQALYGEALALARAAGDAAQCYYHAINLTFFDLAFRKDLRAARARATEVLDFCKQAQSNELAGDRKWRLATQGEALLVLGDAEQAYAHYVQAADPAFEAAPRELESMYQQAIYLSRLIGDQSMRRELTRIFRQGEE